MSETLPPSSLVPADERIVFTVLMCSYVAGGLSRTERDAADVETLESVFTDFGVTGIDGLERVFAQGLGYHEVVFDLHGDNPAVTWRPAADATLLDLARMVEILPAAIETAVLSKPDERLRDPLDEAGNPIPIDLDPASLTPDLLAAIGVHADLGWFFGQQVDGWRDAVEWYFDPTAVSADILGVEGFRLRLMFSMSQ